MDDNTRQVLTTLIQVGGGFMAGVLAAWLGFRWNHALERERLDREDRRQRQERGYAERRDACIDLLTCVSELGALSLTPSPGLLVDPLEFAAMRRKAEWARTIIRLTVPELYPQANHLFGLADELRNQRSDPRRTRQWRQILDEMAPVRRHMNRLTGAVMGDEPPDEPQKGMALAMGPRAKAYPTNGSPNSLPRTATGSASAVEAK